MFMHFINTEGGMEVEDKVSFDHYSKYAEIKFSVWIKYAKIGDQFRYGNGVIIKVPDEYSITSCSDRGISTTEVRNDP